VLDNKRLLLMNVAFDFISEPEALAELSWIEAKSDKGSKNKKAIKYKKKCCQKPKHKRCKRCPKNAN